MEKKLTFGRVMALIVSAFMTPAVLFLGPKLLRVFTPERRAASMLPPST